VYTNIYPVVKRRPPYDGAVKSSTGAALLAAFYAVSRKNGTILFLPLTLPNAGQFSKFFHQ